MKRMTFALSVLAVLGLSACTTGGTWTPMSEGRTAGHGTVKQAPAPKVQKADRAFSHAMHK
ncbi:MAG: hypothetical protein OXT65_05545 [Alphaproteobacteria bacterium]|nr:hypothetical protein [Alphaproteobacteria bacterium]